jgi:glycolate oxidase iron-sulfur subunit
MHLVDHARVRIEKTFRRPFWDRQMRNVLAHVLPYRNRFRAAALLALLGRPLAPLFERFGQPGKRTASMLRLAPARLPKFSRVRPGKRFQPQGQPRARVALLSGCAQQVLAPEINEASVRLLNRFGVEVVLPKGEGCCGAILHHMGRDSRALDLARRNIDVWTREIEENGLDAILITASGCGTTIKDYGHMFRLDPAYAESAARVSTLALDISEYLVRLDLPRALSRDPAVVAYHSACSLQHGQRITTAPKRLLERAGYDVRDIPEGHICCGSAGTYNMLQPEISARLLDRKLRNIAAVAPDIIATGNIGCITQLASAMSIPVVHTVELLERAYAKEELALGAAPVGRGPTPVKPVVTQAGTRGAEVV